MPTYQYRCSECGDELEAVQKFTDPALSECPACSGQLRKVFNAVGVVFKGSGFYRTDSRAAEKKATGTGSTNGTKSDGSSADAAASTSTSSDSTTRESTSGASGRQPATAGSGSSSGRSSTAA